VTAGSFNSFATRDSISPANRAIDNVKRMSIKTLLSTKNYLTNYSTFDLLCQGNILTILHKIKILF